jgi:hypothetical protein
MRIRENLGGILSSINSSTSSPKNKEQIGKVFGVITTKDTPTKELFERSGGWDGVGTVFYLDYDNSKDINETNLLTCKVAKPFHASIQNYPLVGELINIINAPSPTTQIDNNKSQKYYTGVINIWNNNQQNSPSGDFLGRTFSENPDVSKIISNEFSKRVNSSKVTDFMPNLFNCSLLSDDEVRTTRSRLGKVHIK